MPKRKQRLSSDQPINQRNTASNRTWTINFYNLLYLTEKLRQCPTESERAELLRTILHSSTHTWHHINLGGEYDFSESPSGEPVFDLDALIAFPLPANIRRQ